MHPGWIKYHDQFVDHGHTFTYDIVNKDGVRLIYNGGDEVVASINEDGVELSCRTLDASSVCAQGLDHYTPEDFHMMAIVYGINAGDFFVRIARRDDYTWEELALNVLIEMSDFHQHFIVTSENGWYEKVPTSGITCIDDIISYVLKNQRK